MVAGLQDILRAYGATVTGKKEELVARVQDMQRRRHDTVIELSDGSDDGGGDPALVPTRARPSHIAMRYSSLFKSTKMAAEKCLKGANPSQFYSIYHQSLCRCRCNCAEAHQFCM